MEKVRGFIQGSNTLITFPKFSDRHIVFFSNLGFPVVRKGDQVIIKNKKISAQKLNELIHAYEYEFGSWDTDIKG